MIARLQPETRYPVAPSQRDLESLRDSADHQTMTVTASGASRLGVVPFAGLKGNQSPLCPLQILMTADTSTCRAVTVLAAIFLDIRARR
jgi:hypothetical protein